MMMLTTTRLRSFPVIFALAIVMIAPASSAMAASASWLREDAAAALDTLYKNQPSAKDLAQHAKAILVFPTIVKAGFMVGGAYGEGVLIRGGKAVGYYNSVAASYGLQAGAQTFGYAHFL